MSRGAHLVRYWRPLLLAVAVGLFVLLSAYGAGRGAREQAPEPGVPAQWNVQSAEGDTTAETIRTLIAQVDSLERQLQQMDEQQQRRQAAAAAKPPPAPKMPADLARQLQHLDGRLQRLEERPSAVPAQAPLPVGSAPAPRYLSTPALDAGRSAADASVPESRPRFTIPVNTIFFDALALTALVGRVPVDGKVLDPLPVKVLVGGENITAGGHSIPGLSGMLFSGTAIGDWTLECVSVRLHNATFIFADGSVRQLGADTDAPKEAADGAAIAWLSDPQGLPCLPGRLISSAFSDAAQRVLLSAAEGYAGARGRAAISEIASAQGHVLRALSGSASSYSQHGAVQSALAEWRNFVSERYEAGFDAVYIAPGTKVILHVARQLEIDSTPGDRKLVYETAPGRDDARFD